MSSTYDEAGPEGIKASPTEEVATFFDANRNFINITLRTHEAPTDEGFEAVFDSKRSAIMSLSPFFHTRFYRESGDEELVDIAVGAVMRATEQLWQTATTLRPDDPTNINFEDGLKENAVNALLGITDNERFDHDHAAGMLCNTYEQAIQNLSDKFMATEKVVNHRINAVTREERRQRLINYGAVATAAFLGTSVALIINRKKSRQHPTRKRG